MKAKRPLVEKLKSHFIDNPVSFHVPGHKGNMACMDAGTHFWDRILQYDATELPGLDNLHCPTGVIKDAQDLAARAYGVENTYFLVNGSTAGILASLLAVTHPGDTVIVDRHCHSSVFNGLMLGRLKPVYIGRPVDDITGIPLSIDMQEMDRVLEANKGAKAVIITSPSYYGVCSDVKAIADRAGNNGATLIVDEAHGAHLKFGDRLPASAVDAGAHIIIQSAHKTLPAMTQGSWLHVKGKGVDRDRLERMLGIFQTTSPSYLIMASLDAARYTMETTGAQRLKEILEQAENARQSINDIGSGLFCPGSQYFRKKGCYDFDETKLLINCIGAGISGDELDYKLRTTADIYGELYDMANWLGVITIAMKQSDLDRLVEGCRGIKPQRPAKKIPPACLDNRADCNGADPWEVLDRNCVSTALDKARGMIACSGIIPYPPGIPLVCPGERISARSIELMKEYQALGISIKGCKDGRVEVVEE